MNTKAIIKNSLALFLPLLVQSCHGQTANSLAGENTVGGPFENREYMDIGMPKILSSTDTSPGWEDPGQKLLVTGTIYKRDGRTPASGVILYYYQTNVEGRYLHKPGEPRTMPPNTLGQTHGYIRGWVKTGKDGKYSVYTIRPGTYPSRSEPAHIHLSVREPEGKPVII